MRSPQYEDGRRNGVRACVAWLYERAKEMNDPSARSAMTTAADHMSKELRLHEPIVLAHNAHPGENA